MSVRTRFAPSPTGFLHIGGARTALYNWLFARRHGGQFILRVEDTDAARHSEEGLGKILEGLRWLGLDWDEGPGAGGPFEPYYQSERRAIYDRYLDRLRESGHVYEDDGAVRFRVPDRPITVRDVVCGEVSLNLHEQGSLRWDPDLKENVPSNPDLVVRRPDGSFIFHFCNVVDDIEMRISHVIRGEDHLSNTPKHLALFEAFGSAPPVYAHIPLNLNQNGTKMSKRDQGALIHEYMDSGFLPEAVNNYMALLGWSSKDDREIFTRDELVERFDLDGVNNSNSKFDYEKCLWVNAEHLKRLAPGDLLARARPFFARAGIDPMDARVPAAVELTRERAQRLSDMPELVKGAFSDEIIRDPEAVAKIAAKDGVGAVLASLRTALEAAEGWDAEAIQQAIHGAAAGLGQKPGALMLPCRVATMGVASGPDLIPMLAMMGRERVLRRLADFAATLAS